MVNTLCRAHSEHFLLSYDLVRFLRGRGGRAEGPPRAPLSPRGVAHVPQFEPRQPYPINPIVDRLDPAIRVMDGEVVLRLCVPLLSLFEEAFNVR